MTAFFPVGEDAEDAVMRRLRALIRHITFTGLFRGMTIESGFLPSRRGRVLQLRYRLPVPDRDSGNLVQLQQDWCIDTEKAMYQTDAELLDVLHGQARGMALHEIDESFTFDGKRPFDPHRGETT